MRCARPDCPRPADAVIDLGEGLLVVLCARDGVRALVGDGGDQRVRLLSGAEARAGRPALDQRTR